MLRSIVLSAAMDDMPNWFSVCMGLGTVFIGLICIVFICLLIGLFCREKTDKRQDKAQSICKPCESEIENRQELIAAITAAAAEDMGKDISAIRVISFTKI